MEKTKLGISVGMLATIIYFSTAVFGYLALLVVGGYILFIEKTEWLKKCVIKADYTYAVVFVDHYCYRSNSTISQFW